MSIPTRASRIAALVLVGVLAQSVLGDDVSITAETVDASQWWYTIKIVLVNRGPSAINGWRLQFRFAEPISSMWGNGQLRMRAGETCEVEPTSWSTTFPAGGRFEITFNGAPNRFPITLPTEFVWNGAPLAGEPTASAPPPEAQPEGGTVESTPPPPGPVPATNQLAHDNWDGDGAYALTWNLWWGENATAWRLEENGVLVHQAELVANTPNPQSGTYRIVGKPGGTHAYQVFLSNAFGETAGNTVQVVVRGSTQATGPIRIDGEASAHQYTVGAGSESRFSLSREGNPYATYRVATNNPDVVQAEVEGGSTLLVRGLSPGRAGLRIIESSGETRYVGIQVRQADGRPPGWPPYVAIGTVSEDTAADLAFLRGFGEGGIGRRVDARYVYVNGGFRSEWGWRTWTAEDGGRVISYIRESRKLGILPFFVYYQVPGAYGESYYTDLQHVQSATYMAEYYRDLDFFLGLVRREGGDDPVGVVIEPDFLGYMMQMDGRSPEQIPVRTTAAYEAGVLDAGVDPRFPDTLRGMVESINYLIAKKAPNALSGWQANLWASPGIHTSIGWRGVIHKTDEVGIQAGRDAIAREAAEIGSYYVAAGIATHGSDFVTLDKYGLDGAVAMGANPQDPASSVWFWNADHWGNYLVFARNLRQASGLPVVLWQIPVGHINDSLALNPGTGAWFPALTNTSTRYEDSAPTYLLGDAFETAGARHAFFSTNLGNDPKLTSSGSTLQWGSHMEEVADAGIIAILFGAGVGESTDGIGNPPTDSEWWIAKVQEYYRHPQPRGVDGR